MEKQRRIVAIIIIAIAVIIIFSISIIALNKNKNNNNNNDNQNNGNQNEVDIYGPVNYKVENGKKINTSSSISEDKIVDGVKIENTQLVYENGRLKLTSQVKNNDVERKNLRFRVNFIANDDSVMAQSVGFIGQIGKNEVKYIDSDITIDLSNAKDIRYEIVPENEAL